MNTEEQNRIDEIDAKAGRRVKGMTTVLAVSTASIIVIGLITVLVFAT